MTVEYEPFSPEYRQDPYPVYRELRERDPVHWSPDGEVFCVSRYEDVNSVLKQPDLFSSSAMRSVLMNADMGPIRPRYILTLLGFLWKTRIGPLKMQKRGSLVSIDPPRHDVMRNIVNRGFTPRRIHAWEPRAREIVASRMRRLRDAEAFDVMQELAIPLPVTIIAELLGVEAERLDEFKRWTDAVVAVASGPAREDPIGSGMLPHFSALFAYLRETVRSRRRAPADDLISLLVDPAQEGVLDQLDVIMFVLLLLVAGNETTTNLIGNAVEALLDHPDALERAIADDESAPRVVEETMRFDPPIQMVFREATRDTEIRGVRIPKGSIVAPLLASANRDERVFEDPDRFDVDRDSKGHVGFGFGPHFCLGAALARLEAKVALEAIVPELSSLKRSGERADRVDSFLVRGPARLEVVRSS